MAVITGTPSNKAATGAVDLFAGQFVSTEAESERLFLEHAKEILKTATVAAQVYLIPKSAGLYYSVIATAVKDETLGVTAVHLTALECSSPKPDNEFISIGGQNIEVLHVPSDVYDTTAVERATTHLSTLGVSGRITITDGEVFPAHTPIDRMTVAQVIANAIAADMYELKVLGGTVPMAISYLNGHIVKLNAAYGPQKSMSAVGQPIRTDFAIETTVEKRGQGQAGQINSINRINARRLTRVSGFIDFLWAPEAQAWNMAQANPQKFLAQAVISDVAMSEFSMHTALLAVLTSTTIADGQNSWWQVFKQSIGNELHDVGGLNVEGNIENAKTGFGKPVKSGKFTPHELASFMSRLIRSGLLFALDSPAFDAMTWATYPFKPGDASERMVLSVANDLTSGEFSKIYSGRVFEDHVNTIHLGYYVGDSNELRDLREVDYLMVANALGETNPDMLATWTDSFGPTTNNHIRMANRKKIIDLVTNGKAVYTGYATRSTFKREFINALFSAASVSGFRPIVNNSAVSSFGATRYTYGSLAAEAVLGSGFVSGMSAGPTGGYGFSRA